MKTVKNIVRIIGHYIMLQVVIGMAAAFAGITAGAWLGLVAIPATAGVVWLESRRARARTAEAMVA